MLRIALCGGVAVESEGRRLPDTLLAGRQGRLVLAYLVCERHRSVPREELAELVWGDRLPSSWASSLSAVVSKLRRLLGEAGLDGTAALASAFGSYRLHLPEDAWVDWEAAAAATERAEHGARDGDTDAAVAAAEEAQEIARRGFVTDDCRWVDAQRERLRDLHVRAAHAEAKAHLHAGDRGRAVASARDALALDELREASYRLLMLALVAAGERGEALRVWERCRVLLVEELGTDPAPETEAVYLSILGDAPVPVTTALPSGVVTFLLTDIVESSALWERNPTAMAVALERHDQLVTETARAHGGVLLKAKLEGDATVSVFPRASAGALAALALRQAMMSEQWPEGAAPAVRMALHTGEAIERDGDYFGPALNRAARLRSLAGGGQILVSQAVAEVVRDHLPDEVTLRSLGERQLRGLTRGEHVFELAPATRRDAPGDTTPLERPPMSTVLSSREPFVGRGAELDRLATHWATATAGTARAMFIAGEPGVGKTRLAAEWARQVHEQGALVLYGRCDEEFGAPYQPFAEALRVLVPRLGAERLASIRGIEELARLAPELADIVPGLSAPNQGDPDTERYLLFDALVRLVATVSTELPILIVVDDLHWAAKPTLLLLRHLLRSGDGTHLQIVGTYRSTDLDRTHPLAGILADLHRDGTADRLTLAGLDPGEVSTYLSAAGYSDPNLGAALSTVTSGNPFFLIEVLRHVDETGGEWDPSTLPQGVREAVGRRLSRLSHQANEALLVAAVAGSQFSLELVEHVLEHDLVDAVDEARHAGLVVEATGNRFRFNHALVRQSLLTEVASVKRIRLHQRIAAALEADTSATGDAHLADLARHYFECAFAGGAAKAVDYSRRAGEHAMTRLAYEEAADLYDQALQAADVDGSGSSDDDRAELLLARCEALLAAGDPTAAIAVVDQLERAARNSPRLSAWARCFAGQLAVLTHPERLDATARDVAVAVEQFAQIDDAEGEATAHTVLASCLARLGRMADCEAALDRALTAGRRADNPRRVNAVLAGAPLAALWGPSAVARASGRCLDVVRVLRITTGSPAVEAIALRCQAVLEALRGRTDAARGMLGSARRTLEALGHTHGLLETDMFSGMVELYAGESADAETALRRAYDGFVARGVGVDAAQAAALLARAVLAQGRVEEAITLTEQSERLAGVDLKAAIAWRASRAEALAQLGRTTEALEAARAAVALADPTDALIDQADAHQSLSVVLRAAGNDADAENEARRAIDLYGRKGATALVDAVQSLVTAAAAVPTPPAAPVRRRRVSANLATAAQVRGSGRWEQASFDEWTDRVADDYVEFDHHTQTTIDREGYLRTLRMFATMERFTHDVEPVAALGDRHSLARIVNTLEGTPVGPERTGPAGEAELVSVEVARTNRLGRLVLCERFRADDLHLAMARLVELHAEDELPAEQGAGRGRIAGYLSDKTPFTWSEDAVLVDHRLAGLGTLRGRDEIRGAGRALREIAGDVRRRIMDVLGSSERVFLVDMKTEGRTDSGEPFELAMLALGEFDADGLQLRVEWFEPEQVDEALGRFDEWTIGALPSRQRRIRPNRATECLRGGPMDRAHLDEFIAELRDDFTGIDHRMHLEEDRDTIVATWRSMAIGGGAEVEGTKLAALGERHCLTLNTWRSGDAAVQSTLPGPAEVAWLNVLRAATDGRVQYMEQFDADQLHLALARLVELHADDELPADQRDAQYGVADMFRHRNTRWSDDAVLVDHRPTSLGTLTGRDAITAAADALRDVAGDSRRRIGDVLGLTEHLLLFEMVTEGSVDAGGPFELSVLALGESGDDGLCRRQEWYELEQVDAALARFDQLAGQPTVELLANKASVAQDRMYEALLRGDMAEFAAGTHESAVIDDRRSLVGYRGEGRDAVVAHARSVLKAGVTDIVTAPLALRGENLILRREWDRGRDGEAEVLNLGEFRADGLYLGGCVLDPDDLDTAFTELDARYLAGEGKPHADTLVPMLEVLAAYNRRDWARFRALVADDLVVVDHRPAPALYGAIDGPGEFIAAVQTLFEFAPDARVRTLAIHVGGGDTAVFRLSTIAATPEGTVIENAFHLAYAARPGTVTCLEFFAVDQFDAARARLDSLTTPAAAETGADNPSNAVSIRSAELMEQFRTRDWDAFAANVSEGAIADDRRAIVGGIRYEGREGTVALWQSFAAIGVTDVAETTVAIRGDCLALLRVLFVGDVGEGETLSVRQFDDDGLYLGTIAFDAGDLGAAFSELDARYEALLPQEHAGPWRTATALTERYNARDVEGLRDLFDDDAVIVDERVTGWGTLDRGTFLDHLQQLVDMAPDAFLACVAVHQVASHGSAGRFRVVGTVPGGGEFEIPFECVSIVHGGTMARLELLPPGQVDEAVRRLRLWSGPYKT